MCILPLLLLNFEIGTLLTTVQHSFLVVYVHNRSVDLWTDVQNDNSCYLSFCSF